MKSILITLVLFSVSFFSFQPLAVDNKGYYVGDYKLDGLRVNEGIHCNPDDFFGFQVQVIAQNSEGFLLAEVIDKRASCYPDGTFLVPEHSVISQNELRNRYIMEGAPLLPDSKEIEEAAYFIKAPNLQGYEIFQVISIIDKNQGGNLAFHILQDNVKVKRCLAFSGYSRLRRIGQNFSGDIVVEMMGAAFNVKPIQGEEIALCAAGDYLLVPNMFFISSIDKEEGEYIGRGAYYTDGDAKSKDQIRAGRQTVVRSTKAPCDIFGAELTIVEEAEKSVLAQIEKQKEWDCIADFLVLEKSSGSLSFPVVNY